MRGWTKDALWRRVRECFETDDGSLPDISVRDLTSESVVVIYSFLRQRGRLARPDHTFWDTTREVDAPLDSVPNAARAMVSGEAECFHILLDGLASHGVAIPPIGVWFFNNEVVLDYRMGRDWTPSSVRAFFGLIAEICSLAPEARVEPSDLVPDPEAFRAAWSEFRRSANES